MPRKPPRVSMAPPIVRKPWQRSPNQKDRRKRGRAGVEERQRILMEEPLCRECSKAGRVASATEVDHIVPLSEGGSDDRSNKQALCGPCHSAKSAAERAAARARRSAHW